MTTNKQLVCLSMILFWLPFVVGIITNDSTYSFGKLYGISWTSIISGGLAGIVLVDVLGNWYERRQAAKHKRDWKEWKPERGW